MFFRVFKIILNEIDSTQEYLKKSFTNDFNIDFKVNNLKVILSYKQTEGRGSSNRSWISLKGGLYLSLNFPLYLLKIPKQYYSLISVFIGVILLKSLLSFFKYLDNKFGSILNLKIYDTFKDDLKIIFPNDMVLVNQGKIYKLGGILIETYKDNLIIGIGINVINQIENYFKKNQSLFDHIPISIKEYILKKNIYEDILDFLDVIFDLKNSKKILNILADFISVYVIFYLLNLNNLLIEKVLDELIVFDYTPRLRNVKLRYIKQIDNKNQEVEDFFDRIIPDYRFLIVKLVKFNSKTGMLPSNLLSYNMQEFDIVNFSNIRRIFY